MSFATYDLGRLTVAMAHIGVVMLVFKLGLVKWLTSALAAVGQMALTNYIATSIICGFIFNGYGAGLYGSMNRHQLLYVVFAVWILNLVVSPIWLRWFRFGPLEWGWRSLTYWKRQPLRRHQETTAPEQQASAAAQG